MASDKTPASQCSCANPLHETCTGQPNCRAVASMNSAADRELRRGDAVMPIVAWYGLNTAGYEAVDLKENHVLRMFHAGEITAAPLVRQSDAQAALAAKDDNYESAVRGRADMRDALRDARKLLSARAVEIDGLRKDAERWRRLVNASEMAFPVLTIAEDPENDCVLRYGRKKLETLVDGCDEISDAAPAIAKEKS